MSAADEIRRLLQLYAIEKDGFSCWSLKMQLGSYLFDNAEAIAELIEAAEGVAATQEALGVNDTQIQIVLAKLSSTGCEPVDAGNGEG